MARKLCGIIGFSQPPFCTVCVHTRRRNSCIVSRLAIISAALLLSLQQNVSGMRDPSWTGDVSSAESSGRPVRSASRTARALRAMCMRDKDGNINCMSELEEKDTGYKQDTQAPESWVALKGNNMLQTEIQGCIAVAPGVFTAEQDTQDFARGIFSHLLRHENCTFLPRSLILAACHDSWTFSLSSLGFDRNGANGSLRLETDVQPNTYWEIPRTVSLLEELRAWLRDKLAVEISFADLLQLGAAEAVSVAGGPSYRIRMGRVDAEYPDIYDTFPEEGDGLQVQMAKFMAMGLYTQDFVALTAIHSITDAPGSLSTEHFHRVQAGHGGPDQVLMDDLRTSSWVEWFACRQEAFFDAFAEAMVKVSELNSSRLS